MATSRGETDTQVAGAVRSNTAVEVRLLGELRVSIKGQPVHAPAWRRRAARQLFKCLLSRPNRRILKEEAIELLWPESEPAAGDSNFRAALSVLRQALAPIDVLVSDHGSLAIRPGADIWVDADAFQELIANARNAKDPLPLLEEANALYGGDFLAEDLYEDWAGLRRETLKREWKELQFALARSYEQRGKPESAATALERLLHADPSDERAARKLMKLLARQNRRSDALRVFQNLERAMAEDFGVQLAASTHYARDQIVSGQEFEPPPDGDVEAHALPTGTLTYLSTDVEGSRRIWESQPAEMRHGLILLDALFERVIGEHHGVLVQHRGEGDTRLAVFRQASSAVAAAAALQVAVHEHEWPPSEPLRIRIALNTGEADLREHDYYGPAVNRCARLRNIANGGQTLLTGITAELVIDELPSDLQLHDLGTHRLSDLGDRMRQELDQPERVWQLMHAGLRSGVSPLRSRNAGRHNLPTPLTSLVGRDEAIAELCSMTRDSRLLTLTGPGGIGKTRLALAVAHALQDAIGTESRLVELAPLQDPDAVLSTVAQAVGAREHPAFSLLDAVVESVGSQPLILVLDNCEHVLNACSQLIVRLLERCPSLRALATSREPLRVPGEQLWPVPPLEVSSSVAHQEVARSPAVQLFRERARQVQPSFAPDCDAILAIGEICRRLDGVPLAIELAAARVRVLSPQGIAERLDRRLQLLRTESPSVPARQRTLRATIDWSYGLLAPPEQLVFRRLGAFAGGWTTDAAEHLSTADERNGAETIDILARLVDSSLVLSAPETARFHMLETIRAYALEELVSSGNERTTRDAHLKCFLELAEAAESQLGGPQQVSWLARLHEESDNLRGALLWSLESGQTETAARMGAALWQFWRIHGNVTEGRRWLERIINFDGGLNAASRAAVLHGAGGLARHQADYAEALALYEQSLAISAQLGDRGAIAYNLSSLGTTHFLRGDLDMAAALQLRSLELARALDDDNLVSSGLQGLALVAEARGDYAAAERFAQQSLDRLRAYESRSVGLGLGLLADALFGQGKFAEAEQLYLEAHDRLSEIGDKWSTGVILAKMARASASRRDLDVVSDRCAESLRLLRDYGDWLWIARSLQTCALLACLAGDRPHARRVFGAARSIRDAIQAPSTAADRAEVQRLLATARARSEAAFLAGVDQDVRGGTPEQTVADALQWCDMQVARPSVTRHAIALSSLLTPRELDVVQLIARGLTNRQIAEELTVSLRTADTHVEHILRKLDVRSRAQISMWAVEHRFAGRQRAPTSSG